MYIVTNDTLRSRLASGPSSDGQVKTRVHNPRVGVHQNTDK